MAYSSRDGKPGIYNSSLPTLNNGQGSGLAVDVNGRLITSPSAGGETVNITQVNGATVSTAASGTMLVGIADGSGHVIASSTNALNVAEQTTSTSSYPMYDRRDIGLTTLQTDSAGAIQSFSAVTTDEGTSRVNFTGSSLSTSPGTATFTNGSTAVTGTGFTTVDVFYMDYIKLGSDSESAWAQVSFVNSDTSITLTNPYTGTGGTGTYNLSPAATITGTGATISVASGQATVALGTNTAAATNLYRSAGVPSLRNTMWSTQLSVSQRIANQDIYIGVESATSSPRYFSRFHITGTTNTQVITETAYNPTTGPSASETESNTITLPGGANTASINTYKIVSEVDQVYFYINGTLVATHSARLPHIAAQAYYANIRGVNSGSITATSIVCNYVFLRNYERLDLINNLTSRIVGNAGATLDSTVGAGTAPTNQQVVGAIYNSTEISPSTGQAFALQADSKGRLRNIIMDAAGNTRGVNVDAANNLMVNGAYPAGTTLNPYSVRITSNTTTTPTSSLAYISVLTICVETAGTTSTIDIRDKSGTPLYLVRSLSTSAILGNGDLVYNFTTPVKMVGGIDIITGGAAAATVDVFINYYQ